MFHNREEILNEIKSNPHYSFINTNEHTKNRLLLVGIGGSYSRGTYRQSSDLDIRGIILERPHEIIGSTKFTEYLNEDTDSTFWGINKILEHLAKANPNTFELLGLRKEHYFYMTPIGQELLDNRKRFMSMIAASSFSGFADQQLRRLQNALAREVNLTEKEFHILNSIMNSSYAIKNRYKSIEIEKEKMSEYLDFANNNLSNIYKFQGENSIDWHNDELGKRFNGACRRMFLLNGELKAQDELNKIVFYIDQSDREDMDCEIYFDAIFNHYPLRDYQGLNSEFRNIISDFDKLGKRNKKKDDAHTNKHMACLVQVLIEGINCIETGDIKTELEGEWLNLYIEILNGNFRNEDKTINSAFYDILQELTKKFEYVKSNASLPEKPDVEWIEDFKIRVNKQIVNGLETPFF